MAALFWICGFCAISLLKWRAARNGWHRCKELVKYYQYRWARKIFGVQRVSTCQVVLKWLHAPREPSTLISFENKQTCRLVEDWGLYSWRWQPVELICCTINSFEYRKSFEGVAQIVRASNLTLTTCTTGLKVNSKALLQDVWWTVPKNQRFFSKLFKIWVRLLQLTI